jgi:uncharacterized protein
MNDQQVSIVSGNKVVNTDFYFFEGEDDIVYVHLPIRGYAFKTDKAGQTILQRIMNFNVITAEDENSPVIRELNSIGAIGYEKTRPYMQDLTDFEPYEATLLLTETCNLACGYCYAKASSTKHVPMGKDVAKAAVDVALKNALNRPNRTAEFRFLGGGEPTLEWELIVWISNYIRYKADEMEVKYWIRLITNGVLLTDERVGWITKNIQFVTLSFDILPELQMNRPFPNGKSSHKTLLRTIEKLGRFGVKFHLRTTISSDASSRLVEMVEYVKNNTCATTIRFEPMAEIGRANDNELSKPKQQQFVDAFKAAYKLGKEYGIDVTCKMFTNIERRSTRFCNIEFAVTSEGNVAGCHRYSRKNVDGFDMFHVGRFENNKFSFDINKINQLRHIDTDSFSDCKSCFARWSCASGCLSARLTSEGVSSSGPLCHLTRELLKFSVQEALN